MWSSDTPVCHARPLGHPMEEEGVQNANHYCWNVCNQLLECGWIEVEIAVRLKPSVKGGCTSRHYAMRVAVLPMNT